jgi:hypothetical protein
MMRNPLREYKTKIVSKQPLGRQSKVERPNKGKYTKERTQTQEEC